MCTHLFKICILGFLLLLSDFTDAQKNIVINQSLAANSDILNVKMGIQKFGKIWNFRFGDYAVVSSKKGWSTTKSKVNFPGTKSESKTTEKFSFVLCNKTSDSAKVNAANIIEVQSLNQIELLPHFSWGNNELIKGANIFTAYITINNDTTETWALFMNETNDHQAGSSFLAFLTNGQREIMISPASSNVDGSDKRMLPAMGYEFSELKQSLSALQYYGGGALGLNKNIVWIDRNLDDRMKLILASAMTAVLEIKVTAMIPKD